MRYEGKSEEDAVSQASRSLGKAAGELRYRVIRDEKSFWGGRVVEIEVEGGGESREAGVESRESTVGSREPGAGSRESGVETPKPGEPAQAREPAPAGATDAETASLVEATLTELLSAAGLLLEIRRREASGDELLFELIGDDVEPLLANKGEGLMGLEVLAGRIASKRMGRPVHPRLDAEGFRAHRKDALEELAQQSAAQVRQTRQAQLLPPLSPWERRLVHLALAEDPEVETQSEGDGFLKRVEIRLKSR
jgi:spoIIIJ-associated protein